MSCTSATLEGKIDLFKIVVAQSRSTRFTRRRMSRESAAPQYNEARVGNDVKYRRSISIASEDAGYVPPARPSFVLGEDRYEGGALDASSKIFHALIAILTAKASLCKSCSSHGLLFLQIVR